VSERRDLVRALFGLQCGNNIQTLDYVRNFGLENVEKREEKVRRNGYD
jgi:hypothetical protein